MIQLLEFQEDLVLKPEFLTSLVRFYLETELWMYDLSRPKESQYSSKKKYARLASPNLFSRLWLICSSVVECFLGMYEAVGSKLSSEINNKIKKKTVGVGGDGLGSKVLDAQT